MITRPLVLVLFLATTFSGCRFNLFEEPPSLVEQAEELTEEKEYEKAILLYEKHIQTRLAATSRPDLENPYLYLLTIGDLLLLQDKVEAALSKYEEAEKLGVSPGLISDRYRHVASYYEERGELFKAIDILNRYRDRDPLLFDGMLDRLAKEVVRSEDNAPN